MYYTIKVGKSQFLYAVTPPLKDTNFMLHTSREKNVFLNIAKKRRLRNDSIHHRKHKTIKSTQLRHFIPLQIKRAEVGCEPHNISVYPHTM